MTTTYQSCNSTCAEMLGGDCPGETCIYRSNVVPIVGTLTITRDDEPFAGFEWRNLEQAAEDRGMRKGRRVTRAQYRQGFRFGFWLGVLTVFACLFVLAIVQWVAR